MFKWICLAVAVVFLSLFAWILNDVRRVVQESRQIVHTTGQTVNEHLPTIVDKTRKATDVLAENLPEIVQKTRTSTETLAELVEDIRQLKELAGVSNVARDKSLVSYADSVLDFLQASGGTIGVTKTFSSGLKSTLPAKEWVVAARKEAVFLSAVTTSKSEMLRRLSQTKFGFEWYIQVGAEPPAPLETWLRANHPASKELPK